ncbi:glycosyl hydrolase family 28-related protein [Pleomorphomonas oryzae]|uniref:glycosyl hydrolase family 28-related protein n=1 Tax=Pleomorphomonas oryzae TaxID=261934 RepID=UPI000412A444|nr:glycosyl hydrolase family 28-related protein [Pleomorphomonas oryzae]
MGDQISVKDFGALGDGVHDDTSAFVAALAVCEGSQTALHVPPGTYKLSTWATRLSTFVFMRGDGAGVTTLVGPKVIGTHFVKLTGGILDLEGLAFQEFDNVGYSDVSVDAVRIVKCKAKWNRSYFYRQADVTDFPLSSVGRAILDNNEVENSGGFMLHGALPQGGLACNNVMKNVGRDATIWTSDNPLWQTFGISFGDTDNNNSIVSQSLVGAVNIIGNIVDGMGNAAALGNFNTTNAIQVSAISAVVTGNLIRGMDATDGTNCEAIYCKAQNYNISSNTVIDGTKNSACIAVKGTLNNYGPMQKNGLISNNVIVARNNYSESGIIVFAGGEFDIINNLIDGMGKDSIKLYNDPYDARVSGNHIYNNGGAEAITLLAGSVSNVQIHDNTIDHLLATTGNLLPIRVTANPKTLSTILVTSGGGGYTSTPTVVISGGGGTATAQATIKDGAVIGIIVDSSNTGFTSIPTVTISGGGGSGATATAVLSTGKVNNLSIQRNRINWSPKSSLTSACSIYIQSDSLEAGSCGGISIKDNRVFADSDTTHTSIQGINIYSATAGWFRDAEIDGVHMNGPDPSVIKPVNFNSSASLYAQAAHYQSLQINNITVNGLRRRTLTKAQIDENRATFVVAMAGTAVGSKLIGYIPNSVMVTRALVFTNAAPTSGTGAGKVAFSLGGSGVKQILNDTPVTGFTGNTFTACIPDGSAANAKRAFASAGLVPVYMDVAVEALTGGVLTLILETEAIAS